MKSIKLMTLPAVLASACVLSAGAWAQAQSTVAPGKAMDPAMEKPTNAAADLSDGEVRKIDKENGKITLKHGELKNLGMPGMSMVFQVKDKALLDTVKAGDKVKFNAVNENGKFVVTDIQPAK